jgi:hypothetical protein
MACESGRRLLNQNCFRKKKEKKRVNWVKFDQFHTNLS